MSLLSSVQSKTYNSAALLLLLVWTCLIHLESAYVSVFILLRLEIGSALARTLSARLAASFVLDNTGHALLRLKQMRELVDVLVGRREGKRAASCHLLLPVLGGFLVRVKLGDVVIAFAGKTQETGSTAGAGDDDFRGERRGEGVPPASLEGGRDRTGEHILG